MDRKNGRMEMMRAGKQNKTEHLLGVEQSESWLDYVQNQMSDIGDYS